MVKFSPHPDAVRPTSPQREGGGDDNDYLVSRVIIRYAVDETKPIGRGALCGKELRRVGWF